MVVFTWPAYMGDHRAGLVEKHQWTRPHDPADPTRRLYICGPDGAAAQIRRLAGARAVDWKVPDKFATEYSHGFEFAGGKVAEVTELVEVLEDVLTLAHRAHLDHGLVLDWYKVPDDNIDPMRWENTRAGDLIYRGKYCGNRDRALELVDWMADVVEAHPLIRRAQTIVTVPGSAADGKSFGEKLARTVAKRTGKPFVNTESINGARDPQKSGSTGSLDGQFRLPTTITGTALVLDDVYRSGRSMGATALAAKTAGATAVYGLAAVKTMRN